MLTLRPLTTADLVLGMRLKAQAGWNQLIGDWRRALDLGAGYVAELEGEGVGTVATCRFGAVAWIAMMLVDEAVRRRGVGRALMEHALARLDDDGVTTIRLDATPQGRPLYEKLGFVVEYPLARYGGVPRPVSPTLEVSPLLPTDVDELLALDRMATGTERAVLLRRLLAEYPESWRGARREGRLAGFLTSRPGALAVQIGPCAADASAGAALLRDACRRHDGRRVFVDVPDANSASIAALASAGLIVQRPFVRMCRGPRVADRPEMMWACYGPEKG